MVFKIIQILKSSGCKWENYGHEQERRKQKSWWRRGYTPAHSIQDGEF